MQCGMRMGSILVIAVIGCGVALALWKRSELHREDIAMARQPEAAEVVSTAIALAREYRPTASSIGTVVALRSITLRNELPGTVRSVPLESGDVVEAGAVLVVFDTRVEEAELAAQRAEAELSEARLRRVRELVTQRAMSVDELDSALAQQQVKAAQIERTQAVIARKTLRAPFRARVGIADVHPGQYLEEGTPLTTLQGIDPFVYVDFVVAQHVAAGLRAGTSVDVVGDSGQAVSARIVAIDARVDSQTRNATVRARIDATDAMPPGASVRVRFATSATHTGIAVPANALRRSPEGDHVFVLAADSTGSTRARRRLVRTGAVLGDEVLIEKGLAAGEQVAASGSFKLRDAALIVPAAQSAAVAHAAH
jgi:membrane fusion protein, multidrug efflux system